MEAMHRQLLDSTRMAGMADTATNILHNVGNVLNSINVAASCATDQLRRSKITTLGKLSDTLSQHREDWAAFATGAKGTQLPQFIAQITECLLVEREAVLKEMGQLQRNIDHIKDIVTTQQTYAKMSGVTESVRAEDLVQDALRLNSTALARHDVTVKCEVDAVKPVIVDKHKVLGILVNLIRNAKYACDESCKTDKQLTVRVTGDDELVRIGVIDNGVGIPTENMLKIFNHGFTTRKTGHGFGLHSGALAAKELGGELKVQSEGLGKGATFTLELPTRPITEKSLEV